MEKVFSLWEHAGYRLLRPLSSGNHGTCYLVRHENGHFYTIKYYQASAEEECAHEEGVYSALHGDTNANEAFFQAGRISAGDTPALLMQTYDGFTLKEWVEDPAYQEANFAEKLEYWIKAGKAVEAMHRAPSPHLHLDLKPSNFFLSASENRVVKAIDMGSAVPLERYPQATTPEARWSALLQETGFRSTAGYASARVARVGRYLQEGEALSPKERERLLKWEEKIGVQDDIFSLGCCLFYGLTYTPFKAWAEEEDFPDHEKAIGKALEQGGVPPYLIPLLTDHFMQFEAAERDPDASVPFADLREWLEFLKDLQGIFRKQGIHTALMDYYSQKYFHSRIAPADLQWLPHTPQPLTGVEQKILLTGPQGSGKTALLHNLYQQLLQNKKAIPLYIPCFAFNGEPHYLKNYILTHYTGSLAFKNDPLQELTKLLEESTPPLCLLIDGQDETCQSGSGGLFHELNELSCLPNLSLIVACREDHGRTPALTPCPVELLPHELLTEKISGFLYLKERFQELLRLPYYCKQYLALAEGDRGAVQNATVLIRAFYKKQVQKLTGAATSVAQDDYYEYTELIMNSFLIEWALRLAECGLTHFTEEESDAYYEKWQGRLPRSKRFLSDAPYSYLKVLKQQGILREQNGLFYLPRPLRDAFGAMALADFIHKKDDILLHCDPLMGNPAFLRCLGEALGEDEFEEKEGRYGAPSPIERLLDRYRGDPSASPTLIARYIEVMKAARNHRIRGDFHGLNLQEANFCGCDLKNSDFTGAQLSEESFTETPVSTLITGALYREEDAVLYGGGGKVYLMNTQTGSAVALQAHPPEKQIALGVLINQGTALVSDAVYNTVVTPLKKGAVGKPLKHLPHQYPLDAIVANEEGTEFVTVSKDRAVLWDSATLKPTRTFLMPADAVCNKYAFALEGCDLLFGDRKNGLYYHRFDQGVTVPLFATSPLNEPLVALKTDPQNQSYFFATRHSLHLLTADYRVSQEETMFTTVTFPYDLTEEVQGVDLLENRAVITTNGPRVITLYREGEKSFLKETAIPPASLCFYPKIRRDHILGISIFAQCSVLGLDLFLERSLREPLMLIGPRLTAPTPRLLSLAWGRHLRILDAETGAVVETHTFNRDISGHTLYPQGEEPRLFFSVMGEDKIRCYGFNSRRLEEWDYPTRHHVASGVDYDGERLLLADAQYLRIRSHQGNWEEIPSKAYSCAFLGGALLEAEANGTLTLTKGDRKQTFSIGNAPTYDLVLQNECCRKYLSFDIDRHTLSVFGEEQAEGTPPKVIPLEATASFYQCGTDAFCTLDQGTFRFYRLNKDGAILPFLAPLLIPELKEIRAFHHQLLVTLQGNRLFLYREGDLWVYSLAGGKGTLLNTLLPVNLQDASFEKKNFPREEHSFIKIITQNGGIT